MSRLFKASRIQMEDETFILKAPSISKKIAPDEVVISKDERTPDNEARTIIEQAHSEADEIIRVARESAESIVSDAYDEARGIYDKAMSDGYDAGFQEGINNSNSKLLPIIEEAISQKNRYTKLVDEIYKKNERQMVDIVLDVIDKVFDFRMENDPELIEGLIRKAVSKLTKTTNVTIYVSEDDYYHAVSLKDVLILKSDRVDDMEIVKDPDLPRGSCVVHTDQGIVDSSLSVQLEEIKRLFEELITN